MTLKLDISKNFDEPNNMSFAVHYCNSQKPKSFILKHVFPCDQ